MLFQATSSARSLSLLSLLTASISAQPLTQRAPEYTPKPYTINVDPALIEETTLRVSKFRESVNIDAPAWFDGPPASDIEAIRKHWVEEYDWNKVQEKINADFSHFYTTVPAPGGNYNLPLDIHFIHERSNRSDAIPILFLHGWPSTSLEWEKVIHPLANPSNASQPAFHVVAPDLPGYGFSPAAKTPGLGPAEHASAFASLMEQLGYERYVIYSTDLGLPIALSYVVDYAPRIINHITDFYLVFPSDEDYARLAANQTTPEETAYIKSNSAFFDSHSAYSEIHMTLPLSLAYALNDSPLGFAAWRYQLAWTGDDKVPSPEQVITESLLLYFPGVYGNIRSYKELYGTDKFVPSKPFTVPTTVLQFGYEDVPQDHYLDLKYINDVPRDWVERRANVTFFRRHPVGGHFPAQSEPELVIGDIREAMSQ